MDVKLLTHIDNTGSEISRSLRCGKYSIFNFAVAYARRSGVGRIFNDLTEFANNGGKTKGIVGIDQFNTSYQALINLKSLSKNGLFIHNDKNPEITFHPKLYLFGNSDVEKVIIGSSNLTAGGFYLNFEANVKITLDTTSESKVFKKQVKKYWDALIKDDNTKAVNEDLLKQLLELGKIVDETKQKSFREIIKRQNQGPFGSRRKTPTMPPLSPGLISPVPMLSDSFVMTLSGFDVSSRSQDPVVLIPKSTLKIFPMFWHWPDLYALSHSGYPQLYTKATVKIDDVLYKDQHIRIYYYDRKKEFRLQCELVKRNGNAGDILIIKMDKKNPLGFFLEIVRKGTTRHSNIRPLLINTAPGGQKHYSFL